MILIVDGATHSHLWTHLKVKTKIDSVPLDDIYGVALVPASIEEDYVLIFSGRMQYLN
jgi:hypothetical protein